MEITLTPDIERALTEEARKQGTTPQILALNYLRERFRPSVANEPATQEQGTLADFLANHIGVIASSEHIAGGAQMSKDTGKKFAKRLAEKR